MLHASARRILLAALACAAGAWCAPYAAAADKELLDILLGNGAITQAQYDGLLEKQKLERSDVENVGVTLDERGLRVRSADSRYAMKIGTRLHADAATHRGDGDTGVDATNGTELRRARIELSGTFARYFDWAAEVDLADNKTALKDFRIGYSGFDRATVSFGHQKQPYSLALEMSSNDIAFIERGIDNALLEPFLDRAIGVRADIRRDHWFAAFGLFGEAVSPNGNGDEGWGLAGRLVYAPLIENDRVLHLGMRLAYREQPDATPTIRIRDETTHFSSLSVVDTSTLSGIDGVTLFGPEAVWANGPFSVTTEFNSARVARAGGSDLDFNSWHVEATWSLTGESRAPAYSIGAGEFKRLEARNAFRSAGGSGAFELAARYSGIDLNDRDVIGGRERAFTAALNWYLNQNLRLMFNWIHIHDTDGSNAVRRGAEGLDVFAFRSQYTF